MSRTDRKIREKVEIATAPTVISRPSANTILCISSQDRYENYAQSRNGTTYPFAFKIGRGQNLVNGVFTRMALTEFRMVWALPNISAAWGNNQIIIQAEGGPENILTFDDQFWDSITLAAAFQVLIRNLGAPFDAFEVTLDASTGAFFFASMNGTKFKILPMPGSQKQLYDMLAMAPRLNFATLIHSGVPNLRATDFIDITAPTLTQQQHVNDSSSAPVMRNIVARIYLDDGVPSNVPPTTYGGTTGTLTQVAVPPIITNVDTETLTNPQGNNYSNRINGVTPFRLYRQFQYPKQIYWDGTQPIGNLAFELFDDQGRSIQALWEAVYPNVGGVPNEFSSWYINACAWNMTLHVTTD